MRFVMADLTRLKYRHGRWTSSRSRSLPHLHLRNGAKKIFSIWYEGRIPIANCPDATSMRFSKCLEKASRHSVDEAARSFIVTASMALCEAGAEPVWRRSRPVV